MTSCIEIEEIQFIQGFPFRNNSHQRLGHILSASYSFSERRVIASSRIFLKSLIVLIRETKRDTELKQLRQEVFSVLVPPTFRAILHVITISR